MITTQIFFFLILKGIKYLWAVVLVVVGRGTNKLYNFIIIVQRRNNNCVLMWNRPFVARVCYPKVCLYLAK